MQKIQKFIQTLLPRQSIFPLVFALSFNMFVYMGARAVASGWHHYNIETSLDQWIPFWPPAVVIYLGCYLFWAVNYIMIAKQEREKVCQFFSADFLSRVVCLFFYLAFPTTNTRPQVPAQGVWNQVVALLYKMDAADNLFPSIHCLVSWFCYIGLRGRKEIPVWYRGFSCLMAVLVCMSTVLTKQHVAVDVIGGVLLAEICFWIGKKPAVWKRYGRILDKVNGGSSLQKCKK